MHPVNNILNQQKGHHQADISGSSSLYSACLSVARAPFSCRRARSGVEHVLCLTSHLMRSPPEADSSSSACLPRQLCVGEVS